MIRHVIDEAIHPLAASHKPRSRRRRRCGRGQWKVFLDSLEDIRRGIRSVEESPLKEGKQRQRWSFVSAFDPTLLKWTFRWRAL